MPDYAVRITHSYEVAQKIVHEWALRCTRVIVYEHEGEVTEKAHIHLLLQNTSVDKKQLRNIASATGIPVKGNEYMSFKEWDGSSVYITYMTKGIYDPAYNKGFEEAMIEASKASWVPPRQHIKTDSIDKILNDFRDYLFGEKILLDVMYFDETSDVDRFATLKRHARKFAFSSHGYQNNRWSIATLNTYKMLMNTYIYDYNITIPDKETRFQW